MKRRQKLENGRGGGGTFANKLNSTKLKLGLNVTIKKKVKRDEKKKKKKKKKKEEEIRKRKKNKKMRRKKTRLLQTR